MLECQSQRERNRPGKTGGYDTNIVERKMREEDGGRGWVERYTELGIRRAKRGRHFVCMKLVSICFPPSKMLDQGCQLDDEIYHQHFLYIPRYT